jgi:hypothetical protein
MQLAVRIAKASEWLANAHPEIGGLVRNSTLRVVLVAISITLAAGIGVEVKPTFGQAQTGSRYFPETGHTIRGRFLDYWQTYGELSQQGYPISKEMQEVSDIDGKSYTVQYFERAVFEMHRENQPPYDVLLSLLGAMRYKQKYPNKAPQQEPNYSAGSIYFPQTGKRVGGSFLKYWQTYGGLAQQGYPVSDEIQERSELDGKTYTVQYFERAVMEWHPGNTPPSDVLLSHLGSFRYKERYLAAASLPAGARRIATNLMMWGEVENADGKYLYYFIGNEESPAIYRYDLQKDAEFLVTGRPGIKRNLAAEGDMLVWTEIRQDSLATGRGDIRGYDASTGKESNIISDKYIAESTLALDDNVLYYKDASPGHTGLFARDLATGAERLVTDRAAYFMVEDGVLVWSEHVPNAPVRYGVIDKAIHHVLKLDGSIRDTIFLETYGPRPFSVYSVSGDRVVWSDRNNIDWSISLYDIAANRSERVPDSMYPNGPILIGGDALVWSMRRGGPCVVHCQEGSSDASIVWYSLSKRTTRTLINFNENIPMAEALLGRGMLAFTIYDRMDPYERSLYVTPITGR